MRRRHLHQGAGDDAAGTAAASTPSIATARRCGASPPAVGATSIVTHVADFTATPLPWTGLDGILLANALHYVADQPAFLKSLAAAIHGRARFLIVEYDTDRANPWVPYPVSRMRLGTLAAGGRWTVRPLGTRPSIYRRAALYAALLE